MRPSFLFFSLFFFFIFFFFFFHFPNFSVFPVFLKKCVFFLNLSMYMPLLAFVLQFTKRCFLHSRCFKEMWCLDDIGRDSWDWVGPPPGESPRSGVEASCLLKAEPPQIVVLLFRRVHLCVCMSTPHTRATQLG